MIQIEKVTHEFKNRQLFQGINFSITTKSFVSLVGPSGCGKSTLLRIIAGLINPTMGAAHNSLVQNQSFVFQEPCLLPWRTVEQNVRLPLELRDQSLAADKINELIERYLSLVQLQNNKKSYPAELSGGMKMRTSIARALLSGPQLLLLDEPFSALDENTQFELQTELVRLVRQLQMTTVFVTHSLQEALYLSNRIIGLNKNGELNFEYHVDNKNSDPNWRYSDDFSKQMRELRKLFQGNLKDTTLGAT